MQRWYISFHGGDVHHEWNNIHAFTLDGKPLGKALDTSGLPTEMKLRELRGFTFGQDGDLYVSNAWQGGSHILRFKGRLNDRGQHEFRDVFVEQHPSNPALSHPFDVTFGTNGHLFVPSQDTNVVTRYFGLSAGSTPGAPMPVPPAVEALAEASVLPGTFVPSRHHADHGLTSVRGVTFGPDDHLYVVDRDENAVKVYDGETGHHLRSVHHQQLDHPIHIVSRPASRQLLVGSRDHHAILGLDDDTGTMQQIIAPGTGGLHAPSGLEIGADGLLYVGNRDRREILRFDADTGKAVAQPFIAGLHDFPEFLRLVEVN